MFRLNNIKQNLLIVAIATLLTGCGGGGGTSSSPTETAVTGKVVSVPATITLITENSASIDIMGWIANDYTVTSIKYGTTNKYGSTLLVNDESNVILYNLEPSTTYHYKIVAEDSNGKSIVSRDNTFTTLEASTQPIVTNLTVTEPAPTDTNVTTVQTEPIVTEPILVETNNPPEAQNVMIVGTPKVGETLTLEYTFIDADGDSEGDSIIAWSTPTQEVQRGTSKTFTIPAELAGMELSAWVHLSDGTVVNAQGIQASNGYITIEAATPIVEPIVTETIVEEIQAVCIEGNAKIEGHITDKDTGAGLVDVKVNVGGCVTTTDAQGDYTLMNIAINDKAVVTFSAEGYYKNSTVIQITDLSPNYSVVEMDKYISHWAYDSQTHAVSGSHIMIPAGIYINNDGSPYIGQVTAGLSYRTSTEKGTDIAFPGEYKGKDSNGIVTPFVSYGFTVIDLTDENGATLNVSEDITLIFEVTGATGNIIPLWYYDYLQGVWIEEGYATRLADGTYEGTVSHPGTWSLSQPIVDASGIYTDRILYPDGTPVKNLRVHAIADNWISTDLSTDENGIFEVEVIPGEEFTLKAYHYTDKYSSTYNGMISAVAPGDIINNSNL